MYNLVLQFERGLTCTYCLEDTETVPQAFICSSFFHQDAGWCRPFEESVPQSVWHYSSGLGVLLVMCMFSGIGGFNLEVGVLINLMIYISYYLTIIYSII